MKRVKVGENVLPFYVPASIFLAPPEEDSLGQQSIGTLICCQPCKREGQHAHLCMYGGAES